VLLLAGKYDAGLRRRRAAGDLRPAGGSPMIDTATDASYPTDLDGVALPQDGNHDGVAVPDRGAYEYHGPGTAQLARSTAITWRPGWRAPRRPRLS
jgi:hypothetical protein